MILFYIWVRLAILWLSRVEPKPWWTQWVNHLFIGMKGTLQFAFDLYGANWSVCQSTGWMYVMAIYFLNVSNTYLNHSSTPKPRREFRRSSPFNLWVPFHFRARSRWSRLMCRWLIPSHLNWSMSGMPRVVSDFQWFLFREAGGKSPAICQVTGAIKCKPFWGNQTSEGISLQCVVWARNIVTLLGGSSHLVSSW